MIIDCRINLMEVNKMSNEEQQGEYLDWTQFKVEEPEQEQSYVKSIIGDFDLGSLDFGF